MTDAGTVRTYQPRDSKGNVIQNVFFPAGQLIATAGVGITSQASRATSQIASYVSVIALQSTQNCYFKLGVTKGAVSGTGVITQGNADGYLTGNNQPYQLSIRDMRFIGVSQQGIHGATAPVLHVNQLI